MKYSPGIDISDKVGILLRKAHHRARNVLDRHLQPHGLTARHYSILCILNYGQFSQKDMAGMIAVTENVMLKLMQTSTEQKFSMIRAVKCMGS